MTDNQKLEVFLMSKIQVDYSSCFSAIQPFTLQELKHLRDLVAYAIVERMVEYSPSVYKPIFPEST